MVLQITFDNKSAKTRPLTRGNANDEATQIIYLFFKDTPWYYKIIRKQKLSWINEPRVSICTQHT